MDIAYCFFGIARTGSGEAANGIYVQHYGTGGEDGHSNGQVFWTGMGISQGLQDNYQICYQFGDLRQLLLLSTRGNDLRVSIRSEGSLERVDLDLYTMLGT